MESRITKAITIEELVSLLPESVSYLINKGIRPLICGEPIWGSLEEVVLAKGYSESELAQMVSELNNLLNAKVR
ncbi:MAG: DUF1858 domain-containing protein [Ignavibacteria bacterium]|nr:DUF1858 domain-containing protein [Ignavibacteria bacterium]